MDALSVGALPSERKFGITFAVALAAAGSYGFFQAWSLPTYGVCLLLSIAFCVAGLAAPRLLAPLNKAWFRLGLALGKIVNPIVLGLIFFAILTPIAFVTRLFGRDELRLRRPATASYWHARDKSCTGDSFRHQF